MPRIAIFNKNNLIIEQRFSSYFLVGAKKLNMPYLGSNLPRIKEHEMSELIFQMDLDVYSQDGNKVGQLIPNEILMPYQINVQSVLMPDDAMQGYSQFSLKFLRNSWEMVINEKKCSIGLYRGVNLVWSSVKFQKEEVEIYIEIMDKERSLLLGNNSSPHPIPS